MAGLALLAATTPEDDALMRRAQRTLAAAREQAPSLVRGDPRCSARITAGDLAVLELVITGALAEVMRLQDRVDVLEGR